MSSNDAVFKAFEGVLIEKVISSGGKSASSHKRMVEKAIRQFNDNVYKTMVDRDLFSQGEGEIPDEIQGSGYYTRWNRLHDDYVNRKFMTGMSTSFYQRTGDLMREMKARSGTRDFGRAEVTVGIQGRGLDESTYKEDAQGRIRYKSGSRGGQFASSAVFDSLVFSIKARLFTKIEGVPDEGYLMGIYGAKSIWTKLLTGEFGASGSRRGVQPARPLLRPFLDWYTTTHFDEFIAELSKSKV